jgi:hypothetical protein
MYRRGLLLAVISAMLSAVPAGAREVDLTGVWQFRLTPIFEPSHPDEAQAIQNELVLYDRDGALGGFTSLYQIHGKRSVKEVSLRIFQQNMSSYALSYASVEGKVTGPDTIKGTCMMSNPSWGVEGISVADFLAVRTEKGAASVMGKVTVSQQEVGINWQKLCEEFGVDAIIGNLFEDMSEGVIVPFNICQLSKDGGGYYTLGTTGPGRTRIFGTATTYVPVEWACCDSREYSFNVSNAGSLGDIADVLKALQVATKLLGYLHVDIAFIDTAVQDFFNTYGDFAICSGTSTRDGNSSIYIVVSNSSADCEAMQNSELVQIIKKVVPKISDVYCGNSINDNFYLRRSPFPLSNPCNTPVLFVYWLGTLNVKFN